MTEIFNLSDWRQTLSGAVEDPNLNVYTDSPLSIVTIEEYRSIVRRDFDLGPSKPVDRFVWGKGKPDERHATKMNGLPYRPRGLPWPQNHGKPMTFLLQLCFIDSKDHLSGLPGDVLLVFGTETRFVTGRDGLTFDPDDETYGLHFEWHDLDTSELCNTPEVYVPVVKFPTCFGVRHRSVDFENAANVELFEEVVPSTLLPPTAYGRRRAALEAFNRHPGTKIGGLPLSSECADEEMPGTFIASISGVSLSTGPYPWINQQEPIPPRMNVADENFFMFNAHGYIHLFLTSSGEIACLADRD